MRSKNRRSPFLGLKNLKRMPTEIRSGFLLTLIATLDRETLSTIKDSIVRKTRIVNGELRIKPLRLVIKSVSDSTLSVMYFYKKSCTDAGFCICSMRDIPALRPFLNQSLPFKDVYYAIKDIV